MAMKANWGFQPAAAPCLDISVRPCLFAPGSRQAPMYYVVKAYPWKASIYVYKLHRYSYTTIIIVLSSINLWVRSPLSGACWVSGSKSGGWRLYGVISVALLTSLRSPFPSHCTISSLSRLDRRQVSPSDLKFSALAPFQISLAFWPWVASPLLGVTIYLSISF
ncbi:uncharacterized protein BO97DRAFT_161837 [Aspergillus homomorphus CBS 101889]|uniref:Uncharacterized protein n=1 Tax=Aspergillus homomorphus (strain CBS 101889) TaxID=1450537 RepID=A0A395HQR3_ASPHC|nr:hypothetical protein BO97DRAFT_161837 [Aspergillus homomorphus CBS 101889]RAL09635.1 hypothetical protein BO97DRAFT_161837 [Aspergillus homomorphus CBS 101889]